MAFSDLCLPIVANFSNDGVTWGTDVVYDATSSQVSWPLSAGNGAKTVTGECGTAPGTRCCSPGDGDPGCDRTDDTDLRDAHGVLLRFESHDQHRLERVDRCRGQPARLPDLSQHRRHDMVGVGFDGRDDVLEHALQGTDEHDGSTWSHTTDLATHRRQRHRPSSVWRRTNAVDRSTPRRGIAGRPRGGRLHAARAHHRDRAVVARDGRDVQQHLERAAFRGVHPGPQSQRSTTCGSRSTASRRTCVRRRTSTVRRRRATSTSTRTSTGRRSVSRTTSATA